MILNEIMERVNSLKESDLCNVFESEKIQPGEIIVADMSDLQRRLYSVAHQYQKELRQIKATMLHMEAQITVEEQDGSKIEERKNKELHEINLTMDLISQKRNTVMNLLWCDIKENANHLTPVNASAFHLRTGNKITYVTRSTETPNMPDCFKGFFPGK